jgi:two-component system NtrC family sensor kinase
VPTRPRSLTQKLILPLTVLVVLVAVVSGLVRTRAVERGYHETMIIGADQLSRSLASATWHAMLADDRPAAYDTMRTVARQQGITRIRIFNKEGRIMFSTAPEGGRMVDKNAEACVLCHASAEPLVRVETPSRARVFSEADGQRRLAMITPIYNEPSCSTAACHAHPARQSVLGVLDVALDLAPVDRRVSETRGRILVTTVLEMLLVSAFVAVFVGFFVTRPIHRLIEATAALGRMDLEHPVEIGSSRELWELARSFNTMRDRLGEAMAEIGRASQELEAKVQERTEQLRQAHQHLVQADRLASLGQLAASVAHEINNPLSGVLNYSALMGRILKEDGVPKERVAEFRAYLERVSEQTARAGRIVSDLLSFSRRSKPQRAPADLGAIVRGTVSLVSHKLRLSGVEAELRLDEGLPLLPCDASQVQQVVLNLVMNAAEATRGRGHGRVSVRTRRSDDGQAALLQVEDDGAGIAPENLDRIFDPFFTTKEEGRSLGLGLAVVYGIVEGHGGTIDVSSRPGQGATFTVRLPLAADNGHPVDGDGSGAAPIA